MVPSPEKKARISSFSCSLPVDVEQGEEGRGGGGGGRGGGGEGNGKGKCVPEEGQREETSECGPRKAVSHQMGALSGLAAYSSSDSSDTDS